MSTLPVSRSEGEAGSVGLLCSDLRMDRAILLCSSFDVRPWGCLRMPGSAADPWRTVRYHDLLKPRERASPLFLCVKSRITPGLFLLAKYYMGPYICMTGWRITVNRDKASRPFSCAEAVTVHIPHTPRCYRDRRASGAESCSDWTRFWPRPLRSCRLGEALREDWAMLVKVRRMGGSSFDRMTARLRRNGLCAIGRIAIEFTDWLPVGAY